jgi:hypothetical protein
MIHEQDLPLILISNMIVIYALYLVTHQCRGLRSNSGSMFEVRKAFVQCTDSIVNTETSKVHLIVNKGLQ